MQNEMQDDFNALRSFPRQALMKLSVILMLATSAVCAAPVVSCRMGLGERGTFRIARNWLLVCGLGAETYDGIPRWTVEVVRESDKDDNRLLPNQWHGLMPCEVAPALVKTNYTHLMAVRGGPWIVRLSVEDVKVRNGRLANGEAQVDVLPRFDKPIRALSGTEILLRQAPDGGVPDLRIRRNGVENSLGPGALLSFFGGWNADAWVDAVAFTNILGGDGFAVTVSADGRRKTRYYAESSGSLRTLATSWGCEDAHLDPLSGWEDFAVDLDGDGIRELVCQHDDTHVHESERNGRACRVVRIYRCRKGIVEICDDLSPLLAEPDRSVPKVATSWEWLPHSGKVGLVYETGGGKRHVLELCPDLTRLSFRPVTVDGY